MNRILFLVFIFFAAVFGRENPFAPTGELNSSIATSNVAPSLPPFEKQYVKFPSDARELISVSFKYKSGDGSIKEKNVNIDKSIDYRDEFVLQKIVSPAAVAIRADDISVTKTAPKIALKQTEDGNESVSVKQTTEENLTQNPKAQPLKEIVINPLEASEPVKTFDFRGAKFELSASEMKIIAKDKKIKDFAIEKNRIVIDFKGKNSFYTKKIRLDCGAFKDVTFGSHDGYYRMVVSLESKYKYDISEIKEGYLLKVRK
jgi:putative periplasmic protein